MLSDSNGNNLKDTDEVEFGFLLASSMISQRPIREKWIEWLVRDGPLFHYTTVGGFRGIIEHSGFWLSHCSFMNDSAEILHGIDFVRLSLDRICESKIINEKFKHILADVLPHIEKAKPNTYICCFSKSSDDLSQWRAYGDTTGIQIEFSESQTGWPHFGILPVFCLQKTIYNDRLKYKIITHIVKTYQNYYLRDQSNTDKYYDNEYASHIASSLNFYIPMFKHSAFSAEQEIRLVYNRDNWKEDFHKICFRNRGNFIVPYVETYQLKLRKEGEIEWLKPDKLPINSVMIGPSEHQAVIAQGVSIYLEHHGYNPNVVRKSDIPFRR